jgi:thiamine-monophosphate kinase
MEMKPSPFREYQLIQRLASDFKRSPAQVNPLFGSDSEMVRLQECADAMIALTTDGIVEEIEQGLYSDPFLVGWMTVIVNLSDLAAVGARAEDVLIQLNLPTGPDESLLSGLRLGQASLRSRDAFWDIRVPKTHSIFDSH